MSTDIEVRIKEAENTRKNLHAIVDKYIDDYIAGLSEDTSQIDKKPISMQYTLSTDPSVFKGKKPFSLTFSDGRTVSAHTWRNVVKELLLDCCADEERYEKLQKLCDRVYGRRRLLFSNSPDKLQAPICVNGEFFIEGKFDADFLMRVVTKSILAPVGYDYSDTVVSVRAKYSNQFEVGHTVECEIIENNTEEGNQNDMTLEM